MTTTTQKHSTRWTSRWSTALISSALILGLFTVTAQAAEHNLKIGVLESPSGSNTLGWKAFEQYVESNSGGRIAIDILP